MVAVKNFTPTELLVTNTGMQNMPSSFEEWSNLYHTAVSLQRLRDAFGKAIRVTSGFRSPAVNRAVKGANNSAHLHGLAADIQAYAASEAANRRLFAVAERMLQELSIDQLIVYTTTGTQDGNIRWIHVGFSSGTPRHQVFFSK